MVLQVINKIRSHVGVEKREATRQELIKNLLPAKTPVSK